MGETIAKEQGRAGCSSTPSQLEALSIPESHSGMYLVAAFVRIRRLLTNKWVTEYDGTVWISRSIADCGLERYQILCWWAWNSLRLGCSLFSELHLTYDGIEIFAAYRNHWYERLLPGHFLRAIARFTMSKIWPHRWSFYEYFDCGLPWWNKRRCTAVSQNACTVLIRQINSTSGVSFRSHWQLNSSLKTLVRHQMREMFIFSNSISWKNTFEPQLQLFEDDIFYLTHRVQDT